MIVGETINNVAAAFGVPVVLLRHIKQAETQQDVGISRLGKIIAAQIDEPAPRAETARDRARIAGNVVIKVHHPDNAGQVKRLVHAVIHAQRQPQAVGINVTFVVNGVCIQPLDQKAAEHQQPVIDRMAQKQRARRKRSVQPVGIQIAQLELQRHRHLAASAGPKACDPPGRGQRHIAPAIRSPQGAHAFLDRADHHPCGNFGQFGNCRICRTRNVVG